MFKNKMKNRIGKAFILIIIAMLFLGPLLKLCYMSFKVSGEFSIDNYVKLLSADRTRTAIFNTIVIATAVSLLATIIGLVLSIVIVYTNIKYKKALKILILFPFVIPSYVMTLAYTNVFSTNSLVNRFLTGLGLSGVNLFSMGGIIFVMTVCNIPIIYTIVSSTLRKIPQEQEWASYTSGYGVLRTLFNINIRSAMPAIIAGFILSFLSTLDNFSVPAFLGVPGKVTVLSTYIYEKAIGFGPSAFGEAASLSMILSLIVIVIMYLEKRTVGTNVERDVTISDYGSRIELNGRLRSAVQYGSMIFLVAINIVPLFMMVGSSLSANYGESFTLENYVKLFKNISVIDGIKNSFILAVLTTGITMALGVYVAHRKRRNSSKVLGLYEKSAAMTYAIPGIVLSLSMIFFWTEPLPGVRPKIYGTIAILLIAYISRFSIMLIKGANTAFISVSNEMEDAAMVCRSSRLDYWTKIVLPMIYRQLLSSGFLVFTVALTELSLSSMLASAGTKTIGMTIYNFQHMGDYNMAYAFSTVVIILIGIAIIPLSITKYREKVSVHEFKNREYLERVPGKART